MLMWDLFSLLWLWLVMIKGSKVKTIWNWSVLLCRNIFEYKNNTLLLLVFCYKISLEDKLSMASYSCSYPRYYAIEHAHWPSLRAYQWSFT